MTQNDTFLGLRLTYRTIFWFLVVYGMLLVAVVVIMFPVFWMASSSLKPQPELFARKLTLVPIDWTLENYRNVWQGTDFPIYFVNSFKVAAISTAVSVTISIYAAYAIAQIRFPGRYAYGLLLLVTQMFPHILLVIPMFLIIQRMGLINTHAALIIAYTSLLAAVHDLDAARFLRGHSPRSWKRRRRSTARRS